MPGAALSLCEREEIGVALAADRGVSWASLAARLGRHPSTIAREVARNGGRDAYRPVAADRCAQACRRRPRTPLLGRPGPLRDRVRAELSVGRSPLAIWADLAAEDAERVCVETIYTAVYDGTLDLNATECLRRRQAKRRRRQTRHSSTRPALPNIALRPAAVNDRCEAGHWEADQIIGANNQSSMLWLTERVTRYSIPVTMPEGYAADAVVAGLVEALENIPAHLRRSITFDQGSEWALWETIAATYTLDCWFCDPHSPWQRGQVENLNRQWRWWFPRGTDLSIITPAHAQHAADIINGQRRRSLDYHSPNMLYAQASVH